MSRKQYFLTADNDAIQGMNVLSDHQLNASRKNSPKKNASRTCFSNMIVYMHQLGNSGIQGKKKKKTAPSLIPTFFFWNSPYLDGPILEDVKTFYYIRKPWMPCIL